MGEFMHKMLYFVFNTPFCPFCYLQSSVFMNLGMGPPQLYEVGGGGVFPPHPAMASKWGLV